LIEQFAYTDLLQFKAAQYLRLAEGAGRKSVGNSWIWKDKYNAPTK
jgi:hypothetical protein